MLETTSPDSKGATRKNERYEAKAELGGGRVKEMATTNSLPPQNINTAATKIVEVSRFPIRILGKYGSCVPEFLSD